MLTLKHFLALFSIFACPRIFFIYPTKHFACSMNFIEFDDKYSFIALFSFLRVITIAQHFACEVSMW